MGEHAKAEQQKPLEQLAKPEVVTRMERVDRILARLEEDRVAVEWTINLLNRFIERGEQSFSPSLKIYRVELWSFKNTLKTCGEIAEAIKKHGAAWSKETDAFEALILKMHGAVSHLKQIDSSFVNSGALASNANTDQFIALVSDAFKAIGQWNLAVETDAVEKFKKIANVITHE